MTHTQQLILLDCILIGPTWLIWLWIASKLQDFALVTTRSHDCDRIVRLHCNCAGIVACHGNVCFNGLVCIGQQTVLQPFLVGCNFDPIESHPVLIASGLHKIHNLSINLQSLQELQSRCNSSQLCQLWRGSESHDNGRNVPFFKIEWIAQGLEACPEIHWNCTILHQSSWL